MAFDLPAEVIDDLACIQKTIADGGVKIGWVAPQNIHLTVKFLGEISPEAVQKAMAVAGQAVKGGAPMQLAAKGIGVFPDMNRPRVVWAGLSGDLRSLVDFQRILEENLATACFEKEKRSFKAHVTLGRVKSAVDVRKLAAAMSPCLDFQSKSFCIDRLMVYKSDLTAGVPIYTRLSEFALGG
ncbi:MAG: RNA 2',3'-cyclic phosphodiesterase [Thermodesulfobacteriota bacterium]